MSTTSGEFVFIKSVKDGIPNRDPLADSNARRIFDEEDGRISLSDVSLKRDVRDYLIAKFENESSHQNHVFVQEKRTVDNKLLGRASLADELRKLAGQEAAKLSYRDLLTQYAIDVRAFGVTFSVSKEKFDLTGPIQISWAHSMHPAETRYVQGTVVIPSKDVKDDGKGGEKNEAKEQGTIWSAHSMHPAETRYVQGTVVMPSKDVKDDGKGGEKNEAKEQGTIWSSFTLPFAVFINAGVVNASIAKQTGLSSDDVELVLEGLWRGTQHRQARGRGIQQPQFLLHVEYKNPLFRIGDLTDTVKLEPDADAWRSGNAPRSISDVKLDISGLAKILEYNKDKIERCRVWVQPRLPLIGQLPDFIEKYDDWHL